VVPNEQLFGGKIEVKLVFFEENSKKFQIVASRLFKFQ
jgi:hypothetical protein